MSKVPLVVGLMLKRKHARLGVDGYEKEVSAKFA